MWSRDGRELFYVQGNRMMAVEVTLSPAFSATKPRMLFERRIQRVPNFRNYDVAPDGRRFLVLPGPENTPEPTQIRLVLNWSEELRRKLGDAK